MKFTLLIGCTFLITIGICFAASTAKVDTTASAPTTGPTTTKATQPPTAATTPAPTPAEQCKQNNASCEKCVGVGSVQCVWCESKKSCTLKKQLIPTTECDLGDAKWAVCWVNYKALLIASGVIGSILILALTVCICCCCCCKKDRSAKYAKEDAKVDRKKSEMKEKHAERRKERKEKTDEIRRKYGLVKDETPYSKFSNDE